MSQPQQAALKRLDAVKAEKQERITKVLIKV